MHMHASFMDHPCFSQVSGRRFILFFLGFDEAPRSPRSGSITRDLFAVNWQI